MNMPISYQIIDRHTGRQVGKDYSNHTKARTRVDKLDNEYGAYRYYVLFVYAANTTNNTSETN